MLSHASRTLKFWQDNEFTPLMAVEFTGELDYVNELDDVPSPQITFDDQSYIEYQAYEGHPCLVAVNSVGVVEANW